MITGCILPLCFMVFKALLQFFFFRYFIKQQPIDFGHQFVPFAVRHFLLERGQIEPIRRPLLNCVRAGDIRQFCLGQSPFAADGLGSPYLHRVLQSPHLHSYPLQILQRFAEGGSFSQLVVEEMQVFPLRYVFPSYLKSVIDYLCLLADQHGPQIHDSFLIILYNFPHLSFLLHLHLSPQESVGPMFVEGVVLLVDGLREGVTKTVLSEGHELLGEANLHCERIDSLPESFLELFVFFLEHFDTDVEEG